MPVLAGEVVTCEDLCGELSYRVVDDCLSNGNSVNQCLSQALLFLQGCYLDPCHSPNREPTCTLVCEGAGRAGSTDCVARGGFSEFCAEVSRTDLLDCLENLCQVDLPDPPCPVECQQEADDTLDDCVRDGTAWEFCVLESVTETELCLIKDCPPPPVCAGNCTAKQYADRLGDAVFRPTDVDRNAPFDPDDRGPIELMSIKIGGWAPASRPLVTPLDAFTGAFALGADLVRINLEVRGLVNPPGPIGPSFANPYRYGTNPLYGFVELDMDRDADTGGEIETPQFRYLSNLARFGGRTVRPELFPRVLINGADLDSDFDTPPFIERSGEEFHIALLGNHIVTVTEITGNGNGRFEAGESWLIQGRHFHRAHGFERFSFAEGGDTAGEYLPLHPMLFTHDPLRDVTHVSILFPLTQAGSALLRGEPEAPINSDPTDQASVFEALVDLRLSAEFLLSAPTGLPEEQIILGWAGKNPGDYLDPRAWIPTVLLGTSYTPPGPANAFFVWTDVFPNPELGDVDGSGYRGAHDASLIAQWVGTRDLTDGILDQSAPVPLFASRFSLFDVNYDGVVDENDVPLSTGDTDHDGDADLRDFAHFQPCFGQSSARGLCATHDFDRSRNIDNADMAMFRWGMGGPGSK